MKYRVETFTENEWRRVSTHKNRMLAEANAETLAKSRKCHARVIYQGQIINEYRGRK
jgi:hypothetical protein